MTDPATLERLALAAGFDLAHPAAWGEIGENNLGRPVWIGASINPPAEPSYRYVALHTLTAEKLARFAEIVRADERERCAKVCEERMTFWQRDDGRVYEDEMCAAAIRALKDAP